MNLMGFFIMIFKILFELVTYLLFVFYVVVFGPQPTITLHFGAQKHLGMRALSPFAAVRF